MLFPKIVNLQEFDFYPFSSVSFIKVSQGSLNTLVNKLMCLNRIYGILFVATELVRSSHLLSAWSVVLDADQAWSCSAQQFCVKFMSLCFWTNQLIIALIRYFWVICPIETHNRYPSREHKNNLFFKLVR